MSNGYSFRSIGATAHATGNGALPHLDLRLPCAICDEAFMYAAGDRQLAQLRGVELLPKLCPECRRKAWHRA